MQVRAQEDYKIIRETQSICTQCYSTIKASIVERNDHVFLRKECSEHGIFEVPFAFNSEFYRFFQEKSLPFMCGMQSQSEIEIVVTYRCNMRCPICYWQKHKDKYEQVEPSLEELEQFISKYRKKTWRFTLTGGEPTLRDDLPEIISMLKKHGKGISINSNGLRLADFAYAQSLKRAGIDRVNMQLDGFDEEIERYMRGDDYRATKQKALNNLKELNICTGINAVISRDYGKNQISQLIDFALKHEFIKSITWLSLVYPAGKEKYNPKNFIMANEVLDFIQEETKGKITKHNFLILRKLYLLAAYCFSRGCCRYSYMYMLIRKQGHYEGIDRYLDLKKINKFLDICQGVLIKNKLLGKIFFLSAMPVVLLVCFRSVSLLKEFFCRGVSFYLRGSSYLKPINFLDFRVVTICDINNFDSVGKQCCFGIALKDDKGLYRDTIRNVNLKISTS